MERSGKTRDAELFSVFKDNRNFKKEGNRENKTLLIQNLGKQFQKQSMNKKCAQCFLCPKQGRNSAHKKTFTI